MDARDCLRAYDALRSALSTNNLQWVADQVSEEIRQGKTILKEVETLREGPSLTIDDARTSRLQRGPRATLPVTVEYDACEQLGLLIDAIERAVVDTASMEAHLSEYFGSHETAWNGIEFDDGQPGTSAVRLDKQRALSRNGHASRLKEALAAVKREL
jgi:hypothetical protein